MSLVGFSWLLFVNADVFVCILVTVFAGVVFYVGFVFYRVGIYLYWVFGLFVCMVVYI